MTVDTSAEAVERLAKALKRDIDWRPGSLCADAAATLRALAGERDALAINLAAKEAAAQSALDDAWADRDRLAAEVARLRGALEGMLAAFEYDGATEGECNACHAARTALAGDTPAVPFLTTGSGDDSGAVEMARSPLTGDTP